MIVDAANVLLLAATRPDSYGVQRLTWSMRGTQPFMLEAMSIFISPDHLLGKHFETGLANLKAVAEEAQDRG